MVEVFDNVNEILKRKDIQNQIVRAVIHDDFVKLTTWGDC